MMMMIWTRRHVPVWKQIVRVAIVSGASAAIAVGLEILRRKLGIGMPVVELSRNGRGTRMKVSVRTTRAGRGRRRTTAMAARS